MSPIVISFAAFMAVAALMFAVMQLFGDKGQNRVEDRLAALSGGRGAGSLEGRGVLKDELVRDGFNGLDAMLKNLFQRFDGLRHFFVQADCPISAQNFLAICAGTGFLGVIVAILFRSPAPLYPVVALVMAVLPFGWLWQRRAGRFAKFAKQLPDALELIGRALRSGHSLASGMKVVVDEMPAPISTEFSNVYESQNLGIPLDQAMKDMLHRMPNMDLKFFVTAVILQRQTGGDMAEILDKIGHIIRERFRILGQVQALTGEGRISGVVLMGLPIALFFGCYYMNPDYVMVLFTDPLGKKMIAGAAVLQVMGAICIKKIVNIKV
jgi:tight adherence protein B